MGIIYLVLAWAAEYHLSSYLREVARTVLELNGRLECIEKILMAPSTGPWLQIEPLDPLW